MSQVSKEVQIWNGVDDANRTELDGPKRRKALVGLGEAVPTTLAERVYRRYLEAAADLLWGALGDASAVHEDVLLGVLRSSDALQARALVASHEEGGLETLREASAFLHAISKSTNVPGMAKRLPKMSASPAFSRAAGRVVEDVESRPREILAFWALVWVAAQARPELLDDLSQRADAWNSSVPLKSVRAATTAPPKPPRSRPTGPDVPGKVSEVAKWLKGHDPTDPATLALLASRPKQSSATAGAAIRALATVGSDAALEVLTTYRPEIGPDGAVQEGGFGDTFPKAVAVELLRAWDRFDRAAFARRMFSGVARLWLEHSAVFVQDLTGIDAADGLRYLRVLVAPGCELEPLKGCSALTRLHLNVHGWTDGLAPLAGVPRLTHLELVNSTALGQRAVDGLADIQGLERLNVALGRGIDASFLLRLAGLRQIVLARDGEIDEQTVGVVSSLLDRGVELSFYTHQSWPKQLAARLPHATAVDVAGMLALTSRPERSEALRRSLLLNAFLEPEHDLAAHLRTQTVTTLPPIAGG